MSNRLTDMDLAALLCSRVCHDVISPVGAIANGLEVLDEEDDEDMRKLALDLVRRSASQASNKLQFCRLAFGAAGAAGSEIDVGEAGEVARLFVGEEKVKLDWSAPRGPRNKSEVKLLLNLMLLAIAAVPRGGTVAIEATAMRSRRPARGKAPRSPTDLAGERRVPRELDARPVQPYYTQRLGAEAGFPLRTDVRPGRGVRSRARGPSGPIQKTVTRGPPRRGLLAVRRLSGSALAQHVAAAPHRLDEVLAAGRDRQLLPQLADEHVDDLELGLVHAAIEVIEEHLLGERGALAQRQELQHLVFLAGQMHALAADLDGLGVEIDDQVAGGDDRLGVALGAAHDGVDAGHQLVLVERLGHVIVGAEAQAPDLVLDAGKPGQDQDRSVDLADPERLQHFVAGHVGQVQVEQNDVVVVELAEIDALFPEIGGVDVNPSDLSISSMLCAVAYRLRSEELSSNPFKLPRPAGATAADTPAVAVA